MRGIWRIAAALALIAAGGAQAQDRDAMITAGVAMKTKLAQAPKGGAPSLSNADAPLVRSAFDVGILRAIPVTPAIREVCGAITGALSGYYGHARAVTDQSDAAVAAMRLSYQDEIALGLTAMNICTQRLFIAAAASVRTMSAQDRGQMVFALNNMRQIAVASIEGGLAFIANPAVKLANRKMILDALIEDPIVSASSSYGQRQDMLAKLPGYRAQSAPELHAGFDRLAAIWADKACNVLCGGE